MNTYSNWSKMDSKRAFNALNRGGRLFRLAYSIGNGAAVYSHGLETAKGKCYLVSDASLRGLQTPRTTN